MTIVRDLSYNRACGYLVTAGIITEKDVKIKHNSAHDITVFQMDGVTVARYIEKYGRLDIK